MSNRLEVEAEYLTVQQYAEATGMSEATVKRRCAKAWDNAGHVNITDPACAVRRIGRAWLIKKGARL